MIIIPCENTNGVNTASTKPDKPFIASYCDGLNYYYLEAPEDEAALPADIRSAIAASRLQSDGV